MPPEADTNQDPFAQITDKLKSASNVLVTVSNSPTIDQLAACIGLTLALNKAGKHATAVFSGEVPSTIEFLEPEKTLESDTNSLRDFIISLDKSKADKLRYKVEDEVVKIFITPYKTSISDDDLDFSQGDFNIDAVVAIGVQQRSDLDGAIIAHGRILHDAAVLSINTLNRSELGSIDWTDTGASSLCEMIVDVVNEIGDDLLDTQIATALLTGIVAETARFSNDKASPHTMSVAGTLMSAGASTQLVASKLDEAKSGNSSELTDETGESGEEVNPDGTIRIDHEAPGLEIPAVQDMPEDSEPEDEIHIDDHGTLRPVRDYMKDPPAEDDENKPEKNKEQDNEDEDKDEKSSSSRMVMEPPQFSGKLTANDVPQDRQYSPSTDPMSAKNSADATTLSHSSAEPVNASTPLVITPGEVPPPDPAHAVPQIDDNQTLSDIERAVDSAHIKGPDTAESSDEPDLSPLDEIREEVEKAAELAPYQPEPIAGLNAQEIGLDLGHDYQPAPASETESTKPEDQSSTGPPAPPSFTPPADDSQQDSNSTESPPPPPPPVPPPMMPPIN